MNLKTNQFWAIDRFRFANKLILFKMINTKYMLIPWKITHVTISYLDREITCKLSYFIMKLILRNISYFEHSTPLGRKTLKTNIYLLTTSWYLSNLRDNNSFWMSQHLSQFKNTFYHINGNCIWVSYYKSQGKLVALATTIQHSS